MSGWWSKRLWPAWLVLTLLTLAATRVGGASGLSKVAIVALFGIAALKANLVLETFMEASHAERHWRWLYRAWIAAVTMILIAGFVLSES